MSMCRDPTGMCEIETDHGQDFTDTNGHPLNYVQDCKENKVQAGERDMTKLWRINWSEQFGPRDGWSSFSSRSSSSSSASPSSRSRSVSGYNIMRRVRCIPPGNTVRRVPEGSGTSRGRGHGRGKHKSAKAKAKAQADASAKAKHDNAAVH
jgi:hypothetical protein